MVTGLLGATKYAVLPSMGLQASITLPRAKPTASLSILGISGIAAYVGMFVSPSKCPQKGETVVVSAAAGAMGCIAAQMAKLSVKDALRVTIRSSTSCLLIAKQHVLVLQVARVCFIQRKTMLGVV